jgi:branched-chain amino acid transport system substrate-binding protein
MQRANALPRLGRLLLGAGATTAAVVALAACGSSNDSGGGGGSASSAQSCNGAVGVMVPATGDAAQQGQEQLKWARFAVERFNARNGTKLTVREGDTQLDPAQASTVAQEFVSDSKVLAVVGPPSSSEVDATGPLFQRAGLAVVSQGATRGDLTSPRKYQTFFRVVPPDRVQGATDAAFMVDKLKAKKVVIIDDQSSYSTGLAKSVEDALKSRGATVQRESISQKQTDYSALTGKVGADADVVFLPWLLAANAQQFGKQLKEAGKTTTIFGGDGLFSPQDFTIENAYVASFAPDITAIPADADLVKAYQAKYGAFGTYGPPTYAAASVVLEAIRKACADGKASRSAVLANVKATKQSQSILGQPVSFDGNGDIVAAKYFIFQIRGGKFTGVT